MKQRLLAREQLILSALIPVIWFWEPAQSILWKVSWFAVSLLMLIRPLAELFPQQKWIRKLMPYRKELGILSAAVVVWNFLYTMGWKEMVSLDYWNPQLAAAWGHYATLSGILLLVTSNRVSQRKLKRWWKKIQKLSYLYYYGAAIFLISIDQSYVLYSAPVVLLIGTTAMVKKIVSKR